MSAYTENYSENWEPIIKEMVFKCSTMKCPNPLPLTPPQKKVNIVSMMNLAMAVVNLGSISISNSSCEAAAVSCSFQSPSEV